MPTSSADAAHALRYAHLPIVGGFRPRYDPDAFDDFADRVAAALDAANAGQVPDLSAAQVIDELIPRKGWGKGYEAGAGDTLLDVAADALRATEVRVPHMMPA